MQREPFDPSDFEHLTHDVAWINRVHAYAEIGSTNDEAAGRAGAGEPEGTVVVADSQTAGHGRLDRLWIAEPGTSLLCSWIVRPPIPLDQRPLLALAAAVAVADAIERETGVQIALKWPNDVLAGDERKLAGILLQAVPPDAVVVGLGVNVRQDGFDVEIAETATSLLLERSRPVGRARLLGSILIAFAPFAHAPRAALEPYRRRCSTIGRSVRVEQAGGAMVEGVATAVDDDGALLVGGNRVIAGDVVHVRSAT